MYCGMTVVEDIIVAAVDGFSAMVDGLVVVLSIGIGS